MGKCISKQNKTEVSRRSSDPVFLEHKSDTKLRLHLVVDDSSYNRDIIVKYLARVGIECDQAMNGQQGVDMTANKTYDIIWMDMKMPVLDGIAATKKIRENGYNGPIVGVTGAIDNNALKHYADAEISRVLAKPLFKEDLYHITEQLCGYNVIS